MILSAHQPCYLPWLGYFNKMVNSDIFVILNDVQFEKGGYTNRVQIKTPQGAKWLTVPVPKDSYKKNIVEIELTDMSWVMRHYKTVLHNYKKALHFSESYLVRIMNGYDKMSFLPPGDIGDLYDEVCFSDEDGLDGIIPKGDSEFKIWRQSEISIWGIKQELIINLCKHFKADTFLFGTKGRDYVDTDLFEQHGIKPVFQNFKCIEYPQLWGEFIPGLSVIDALFNVGPEKTRELIVRGFEI